MSVTSIARVESLSYNIAKTRNRKTLDPRSLRPRNPGLLLGCTSHHGLAQPSLFFSPKPVANPAHDIRGMPLYAADGSSFSWEIANSAVGGFDATFRSEQSVSGEAYSEGDMHHSLSRETAVGWLRVEAAVRGFDARPIK